MKNQVMYMNSRDLTPRVDAERARAAADLEAKLRQAQADDIPDMDTPPDLSTPTGRFRAILSACHQLSALSMSIRSVTSPPQNQEDTAAQVSLDLTQSAFFANDAKDQFTQLSAWADTVYINAIDDGVRITFVVRDVWLH